MGQLSLSLNFTDSQSKTVRWFREMLETLNVNYQPAWPDEFGLSLREWLLNQNYSPIKTLSLFSGGGGLDIAFHDTGFDILQMVEIEAKYIKTLAKNSLVAKRLEKAKPVCIDIKNFIPDPNLEIDFIALWKAFEEKVSEITGKADLVQLSGYYQYKPKFSGILNFNSPVHINEFWSVVQCVVRGIGVAHQLTAKQLAELWGVDAKNIFNYLQDLRRMGYEIRNQNTNSQIPKGKYLIPYAFPTLNPKSVQLRKTLN